MNKNYASGRAKEYQVKKILQDEGYFVLRSAGSHTSIDLFAIATGKHREEYPLFRAIQVKKGSSPIKHDIEQMQWLKQDLPRYIQFELWQFKKPRQAPEIKII